MIIVKLKKKKNSDVGSSQLIGKVFDGGIRDLDKELSSGADAIG